MNNKRKNRGPPVRSQRRSIVADGVYQNCSFMHAATSQVGTIVRLKTSAGITWEGVFRTFGSNFEVVLEVCARVENPESPTPTLIPETMNEKLIFKTTDIETMIARDVDVEYAIKDTFQTDTAISARLNGAARLEEKELEPWDASCGVNGGDTLPLELDNSANGWDANDMFKKNEQEYGVTSTFDQSLRGYTVPLQQCDSQDYREAEAKANQIANEIENQPAHKARLDLENGDEEAIFAAVHRPGQETAPLASNAGSTMTLSTNGKYIPPAKRKNQNSGKLVRSTPPPSQSSSVQTTPSPKGNPPQMTFPTMAPPPQQQQQQQQQVPIVQQQQQQPPQPHGGGGNRHTPPHGYGGGPGPQQVQQNRQGGNNGHKPQMNGEAKGMQGGQRGGRNMYQNNQAMMQQHYQQEQMKPVQDVMGGGPHGHIPPPRHRGEDPTVKDLQMFAQDFKLAQMQQQPPPHQVVSCPQPPVHQEPPPHHVVAAQAVSHIPPPHSQHPMQVEQVQAVQAGHPMAGPVHQQNMVMAPPQGPPLPQGKPPQQPTPPQQQPKQSVTPPQDRDVDKLNNTLKNSTLNPNAKEFVLNPAAKPFQPRSPSTPSVSRPHTPQTPNHSPYLQATVSGPPGQQPMPMLMPTNYMMVSQPQYQPQPQGTRISRKLPVNQIRADVASQMQVAAATGQPLLAPAPMQPFVFPQVTPQNYPPMHVRMYDAPPQLQYLPQNHSNAPSPAQPPPPYTPQGAQQHQQPPQQYQSGGPPPPPQGHPQFPPLMCAPLIPTQPHVIQGMQYMQQPPPPHQHLPILLQQHHQQQQHGPPTAP